MQLGLHQYTYDANDNILSQQTQLGTQTYQYDGLNRLIQATHAAAFTLPNEAYQYDGVGNRTKNKATPNTYDNNNRLTKIGATTITHNNAGSLTQQGTTTYTYNSEQRLTQTVKGATTTQYQYDAFGRRVKKASGGATTFYLWDNDNLIAEYNTAGQRTKRYAYIPNRHSAIQLQDSNGIYNVHTNHLDTPTQLTDATQKVVWTANYQAFGNTQINPDPDANGKAITYNQRFPGQYADSETGLYYNFYRDYDPGTGRYLQSDPIGLNGGINLYSYVGNNPLFWMDPTGEVAGSNAGAAAGGLGGVLACALTGTCIGNPDQPSKPTYPRPDCPSGTPPLFGPPKLDFPFMNNGSSEGKEKNPKGAKPKDAPTGTKPIDKYGGLSKEDIHTVKDQVLSGPSDWTGISPSGDVITSDSSGNAINHGPVSIFLP